MGYGLLDAGQDTRKQALQGMSQSAQLEAQREAEQQQINSQQKAAQKQQQGAFVGMNLAALAMEVAACF